MDSLIVEQQYQNSSYLPAPEIYQAENKLLQKAVAEKQLIVIPKIHLAPGKNVYTRVGKRAFDITASGILSLTLLVWMIPLFALLIRIGSRGPVFFRQKRIGRNGRSFTCIKFRSMHVNTEADITAAKINDERITGFGNFLRRLHLDELPQLINVLKGEMSLVGPRPYMIIENIYYENIFTGYKRRYYVKPGITGLAQSLGYFGSVHDMENAQERFDLDVLYIEQQSFLSDVKILFRTFLLCLGIKYTYKTGPVVLNKTF